MDPKKELVCKKCAKKFLVSSETKDFLPFCSKRCKMVDLGKWLGEKYVVEGAAAPIDKKTDNEE